MQEHWPDIVAAVRAYALRKYGAYASGITIHIVGAGRDHYEPFPAGAPLGPIDPPPRSPPAWNSGSEPALRSEGKALYWPGVGTFYFSGGKQAGVVLELWDAYQSGRPEVQQSALLRAVDSDAGRLHDLFRGHPAWGKVVVRGRISGSYRLPPLGEEGELDGEAGGEGEGAPE